MLSILTEDREAQVAEFLQELAVIAQVELPSDLWSGFAPESLDNHSICQTYLVVSTRARLTDVQIQEFSTRTRRRWGSSPTLAMHVVQSCVANGAVEAAKEILAPLVMAESADIYFLQAALLARMGQVRYDLLARAQKVRRNRGYGAHPWAIWQAHRELAKIAYRGHAHAHHVIVELLGERPLRPWASLVADESESNDDLGSPNATDFGDDVRTSNDAD